MSKPINSLRLQEIAGVSFKKTDASMKNHFANKDSLHHQVSLQTFVQCFNNIHSLTASNFGTVFSIHWLCVPHFSSLGPLYILCI